jgi:hypothetical protein
MAHVFAFMQGVCGVRAASRYKEYRSQKTITGYKTVSGHLSSVAVQTLSEPEIYHAAEIMLRAAARVRMHVAIQNSLASRGVGAREIGSM